MVNKIKEPTVAKAPSSIPMPSIGKAPKGKIPKSKKAEYEMPQPVPTKKARSKRGM